MSVYISLDLLGQFDGRFDLHLADGYALDIAADRYSKFLRKSRQFDKEGGDEIQGMRQHIIRLEKVLLHPLGTRIPNHLMKERVFLEPQGVSVKITGLIGSPFFSK